MLLGRGTLNGLMRPAIAPVLLYVTDGMQLTQSFVSGQSGITALGELDLFSAKITVDLSPSDTGFICEFGGSNAGMALYCLNGNLYCQLGNSATNRQVGVNCIELVWPILNSGTVIVEVSASKGTRTGALYINGVLVDQMTITQTPVNLIGTDQGAIGFGVADIPQTRMAMVIPAPWTFTNQITAVEFYEGQLTSDVTTQTVRTYGMVESAFWPANTINHLDLVSVKTFSARLPVTLNPTDHGIIFEAGAAGAGIALYAYDGIVSFEGGKGGANKIFGVDAFLNEWTIPSAGTYTIEVSADKRNQRSAMYVDGILVSLHDYTQPIFGFAGGNSGGCGQESSSTCNTRMTGIIPAPYTFTGTLPSGVAIFLDQLTYDVSIP